MFIVFVVDFDGYGDFGCPRLKCIVDEFADSAWCTSVARIPGCTNELIESHESKIRVL